MGSYCELYIADYPVLSTKSHVVPIVMTLFRESDKRVSERKISSRNRITWGRIESGGGKMETIVEYRISKRQAVDRLNVMGFTLHRVKRKFDEWRQAKIGEYREYSNVDDSWPDFYTDKLRILETYTLEDYLEAFRVLLTSHIHPASYIDEIPDTSELMKHILGDDEEELYWGFPHSDIRGLIRAVLEVAPNGSSVIQDITETVHAGYYDQEDPVCEQTLNELARDYPINSRIIVLTEGTTDTEVLKPSLKLLYPHLYDYYSFMDFGMRPPGGVGQMVNLVKSFAGAGIENRIVFLFDNDTAAFSALDTLKDIRIPSNIAMIRYPDIELARTYPTLGPSGSVCLDINGLACSVELYFGKDVLETDGCLEPIQWKGYDERLRRYQGEIMHKPELKGRFLAKLARCQHDSSAFDAEEWAEMNSIFLHIFAAFND